MLTRLTATASAVILAAALAITLPAALAAPAGTARADCVVVNGVVSCVAGGAKHKPGSHRGGKKRTGGNNGPGVGCPGQPNLVPGLLCPINAPAAVRHVPSIDLAWEARGGLVPLAPEIHWSPQPRTYIVKLRTGLWINPDHFTELTHTVGQPGDQTVTAHATPEYVEWNLVETTIRCQNAGSADSTACGYTYQRSSADQPGGKYHITATINWRVTWECNGNCDPGAGTTPLPDISISSAAQLPVDEIQTESQPG
ncbi:MAG TPA: hypothetical protein VF069_00700 [Streptosporangiaceae bacterium]